MRRTRIITRAGRVAVLAAAVWLPASAFAIPLSGLVGLYTFDAANGADGSGNGNDGSVGSGVGFTTPGAGVDGGVAADFSILSTGATPGANAANSIVLPININASNLPQLTMGAWVRPRSTGQGGVGKVLSHDNGGFDRTLGIDSRGSNAGTGYAMFTGGGVLDSPSGLLVLDEWQFIAARYDGVTARLTVGTFHGSASDSTDFDVGLTSLFVGSNPAFNEDFDGLIDNVFVYSRFLSDAEIADIRDNGVLVANVPEPAALSLAAAGLLCGVAARRRRARALHGRSTPGIRCGA